MAEGPSDWESSTGIQEIFSDNEGIILKCGAHDAVVLGGITFLLSVYSITNLEQYSVFYGIWSSKIAKGKLY